MNIRTTERPSVLLNFEFSRAFFIGRIPVITWGQPLAYSSRIISKNIRELRLMALFQILASYRNANLNARNESCEKIVHFKDVVTADEFIDTRLMLSSE